MMVLYIIMDIHVHNIIIVLGFHSLLLQDAGINHA